MLRFVTTLIYYKTKPPEQRRWKGIQETLTVDSPNTLIFFSLLLWSIFPPPRHLHSYPSFSISGFTFSKMWSAQGEQSHQNPITRTVSYLQPVFSPSRKGVSLARRARAVIKAVWRAQWAKRGLWRLEMAGERGAGTHGAPRLRAPLPPGTHCGTRPPWCRARCRAAPRRQAAAAAPGCTWTCHQDRSPRPARPPWHPPQPGNERRVRRAGRPRVAPPSGSSWASASLLTRVSEAYHKQNY